MNTLTKQEAARYLKTTEDQFDRLVAAGQIEPNPLGEFEKTELDNFLAFLAAE
ncbi:MAG: hypothetical protein WBW03_11395 [Silvibacterium sp.]